MKKKHRTGDPYKCAQCRSAPGMPDGVSTIHYSCISQSPLAVISMYDASLKMPIYKMKKFMLMNSSCVFNGILMRLNEHVQYKRGVGWVRSDD